MVDRLNHALALGLAALAWLAFAYAVISLVEWFAHGVFMHKPTWLSRRFGFFKQVLYLHRTFHHGECFHGDDFEKGEGQCLELNIRFDFLQGQLMSSWVWLPLFIAAYLFGVHALVGQICLLGALIMMASVFVHHMIWNAIHVQMHTKPEMRAKWFYQSKACLWLARNHYIHHTYPRVNFCVVCPGADWVLGTYRSPSDKDAATMRAHGLYSQQ